MNEQTLTDDEFKRLTALAAALSSYPIGRYVGRELGTLYVTYTMGSINIDDMLKIQKVVSAHHYALRYLDVTADANWSDNNGDLEFFYNGSLCVKVGVRSTI